MTNKLISLMLILAIIAGCFSINVGAAISDAKLIYEEDFSGASAANGWIFQFEGGAPSKENLGSAKVSSDGWIDLCKGGYDGVVKATYTMPALPSSFTLMYDVMAPEGKGGWIVCSLNGYNQTMTGGGHSCCKRPYYKLYIHYIPVGRCN